ncbi:hypothetical protein [Ruegeria arenilitoris]|uniref:hypothetical protein n=1 Tax=Ruegeria arenilitoris TaxID=1173585 RepID=UPI001479EAE3|nr:hypothetical protein [Ruegeria arenilitoris]
MKFISILAPTALLGFSACTDTGVEDPLVAALAGKTISNGGTVIDVLEDGTFTGTTKNGNTFSGAWEIIGGQWCRTLNPPSPLADQGQVCQETVLGEESVTVTGANGPLVWVIE